MIGRIGTILGEHQVNISRFHLGRRERGGEAMAVIETDAPLKNETPMHCAPSSRLSPPGE